MSLNLVGSRRNLSGLEQLLSRCNGKVANSNTSDLARLDELLKRGPGIGDRNIG